MCFLPYCLLPVASFPGEGTRQRPDGGARQRLTCRPGDFFFYPSRFSFLSVALRLIFFRSKYLLLCSCSDVSLCIHIFSFLLFVCFFICYFGLFHFLFYFIRAKRVSNCYIPKKKFTRVRVCSTNIGFSVGYACVRLMLVLVWGTYYVPDTYVPGISRQKSHHVRCIAW